MEFVSEPIKKKSIYFIVILAIVGFGAVAGGVWWGMRVKEGDVSPQSESGEVVPVLSIPEPAIDPVLREAEVRENFVSSVQGLVRGIEGWNGASGAPFATFVEEQMILIRVPKDVRERYMEVFLLVGKMRETGATLDEEKNILRERLSTLIQ
jgi:hypothetical protein